MSSKYNYNQEYDFGNLTINLSDNMNTMDTSLTGGVDTITLDPSIFNWNNATYTTGSGAVGAQGGSYNIGGLTGTSGNYVFSTTGGFNGTSGTAVDLSENGINIKNGADIKINGKSLSEFMDRVESRLGILQPKPELLEKFEALKLAYEHYKTLEALCMGDIPKDPNGR
jgi:hypothetical protein